MGNKTYTITEKDLKLHYGSASLYDVQEIIREKIEAGYTTIEIEAPKLTGELFSINAPGATIYFKNTDLTNAHITSINCGTLEFKNCVLYNAKLNYNQAKWMIIKDSDLAYIFINENAGKLVSDRYYSTTDILGNQFSVYHGRKGWQISYHGHHPWYKNHLGISLEEFADLHQNPEKYMKKPLEDWEEEFAQFSTVTKALYDMAKTYIEMKSIAL